MQSPLSRPLSRRAFMRRAGMVSVAAGVPVWWAERELAMAGEPGRRLGPNDRPGIALVGCGGMGRGDAR
ncbi:MAG: twin-arginine translocation signal domain-containing protein, partial [Limisphaerales bacterium]